MMERLTEKLYRTSVALAIPLTLLVLACDDPELAGPSSEAAGFSQAYDNWPPGPNDTCTREIHNQYSVVGPDGKLYPTWHPPKDPETDCTFGHEHGRNPRGSDLYSLVGDIPFGYANEQIDIYDPSLARHEDHVGHKMEWENDVEFGFSDGAVGSLFSVECDVLYKMHQGSHSSDAFANNLHELSMHVVCSDGTRLHITLVTPIGDAGEVVSSCNREEVFVRPPVPANSPDGGGVRLIPDRACIEEHLLVPEGEESNFSRALRESWEISDAIRTHDGHRLASFNPYFQVRFPSRFFDPDAPGTVGRPIDLCFQETEDGRRARGEFCEEVNGGTAFDDPRSPFNGAQRFVDINNIRISNADGPEVWYTDPFGNNGRRKPFPGSIRQFIAKVDNDRAAQPNGPAIGRDRDYAGKGVHAPN